MTDAVRMCSVDGCERAPDARGLCSTHYSRLRRTGRVGTAQLLRVSLHGAECAAAGCARSASRKSLCELHYRRGRGPMPDRVCVFCGAHCGDGGRSRRYCSARCARMWQAYEGQRPSMKTCERCGGTVDLLASTKQGHYKRSDARMCAECRRARKTRHGWSVSAIVRIHGSTDCGICHDPVDLTLIAPDRMRASIDHVIPFAHGGSNDPANLQLAHLHCNHVKSDRVLT